jgi:predicted MFS family arabinose efflux permease
MRLPRNLALIYLVVVCTYSAEGFISVALAPYLQSRGVPVSQIGTILAAMGVAALFSRLPSGMLYRPAWANWIIAAASLLVSAVSFAIPRTDSEAVLVGLQLLHGLAFGVSTTTNMAQFFDARPATFERGRAMGLYAAALAAGFLVGNFVGGWWAESFGFEAAFTTAAIFPLVAAVVNLQIRREAKAARERAPAATKPAGSFAASLRLGLGALRNPGILSAALLLLCVNTLNAMFGPFFILYGVSLGLGLTTIGMIQGTGNFCSMFTRLFAGELGRWLSFQAITRIAFTLSALLVFTTPLTDAVWLLAPLVAGVATLRAILTVTGGVSVIDATETTVEQRGVASSLFNMGKDLGVICGPLCGGFVAGQVGIPAMMQVVALAALALFWTSTLLTGPGLRRAQARRAVAAARD